MIHIDRSRLQVPARLRSAAATKAREHIAEFYTLLPDSRTQRRFDFLHHVVPITQQLRPELIELFLQKCVYCESRVGDIATVDIEWFRPKGGSVGLDGSRSPDHYGWLALEWENLYIACPMCNRTKGSRFPVRGERAPVGAGWGELREEAALLLDPCRDQPEEHLVFSSDGTVAAVPFDRLDEREQARYGTPTRGQVTIDTFGLNRANLVEQRQLQAQVLSLVLTSGGPAKALALGPRDQFLGMKRQLVQEWGLSSGPGRPMSVRSRTRGGSRAAARPPKAPDQTTRERAVAEQHAHERQIAAASVELDDDAATYRARAVYVERVEIAGVTVVGDLRFDAFHEQTSTGGDAPWLMLLGENGSGKTSILRAIALALLGPRHLADLQQGPHGSRLAGLFHEGGAVRVFLTSQRQPIEVKRQHGKLVATGNPHGAKVFLRAYGPSRWFPNEGAAPAESDTFVRVRNLFNPFVPLDPGEATLATLEPSKWDDVAGTLKRLLQLPDDGIVPPAADGTLAFRLGGDRPTPLRALSSGYEAVVAMTAELAQMVYTRWGSLLDAEGICLLDEIDAHLHPRWKMRIVESLRRAFPRMQFIASTHEPLCLRGLRAGEILVLRREGGAVTVQRPLDDVAAMRVDQLLTSRLFGLHSTLDPAVEEQLERYYALLSRHESSLDVAELAELAELRRTVGSRGILGSTRRDQLIYSIIDEFVAREPAIADEQERAAAERFTVEQVAEAWGRIPDLPEEPA